MTLRVEGDGRYVGQSAVNLGKLAQQLSDPNLELLVLHARASVSQVQSQRTEKRTST